MARFTSMEFLEALGLSYGDYNGAKILLRLLQKKGIAKEVDRISPTGKGRKMVVYELPEQITLGVTPPDSISSHPVRKKKPKPEPEAVTETEDEEITSHEEDEDSMEVEESEAEDSYEEDEDSMEESEAEEEEAGAQASAEDCEWDYGWDDDE
jgi:hypothetical protein